MIPWVEAGVFMLVITVLVVSWGGPTLSKSNFSAVSFPSKEPDEPLMTWNVDNWCLFQGVEISAWNVPTTG